MKPNVLEVAGLPTLVDVEAELRLRRLVNFVPHLSPKYMPPTHLAPLLERFELAVEGKRQRVLCSAPPRHGKTESVLHVPAFALRRRPELVFAYSTYADRLARSKSRKARALAQAAGVALETPALNEWRTPQGGGLLAGGVGGPLTGHGVDIMVVDDPTKNRLEAESSTYRERLVDWFRDVATTRVEPGGSIFVFATRWHPEDLIGSLANEGGWDVINLPALSDEGAPLWPQRWGVEELLAKKRDVGEYTWASLYQGQPRPRGGRVFGDAHTYDTVPAAARHALGIDLAYSAKTTSDYSICVDMAEFQGIYYVVEVRRAQVTAPAFKRSVHSMHANQPDARVRWYASGTEQGAASFFAAEPDAVPLVVFPARGDKHTRALSYAAAWNAGRVRVPKRAPWLSAFLSVHAGFTGVNDSHDDDVDASVAAFDELATAIDDGDIPRKMRAPRPRGLMAEGM